MKSNFIPDKTYDKIQDIEIQWLKRHGITGVICDLDNTLAWYYDPLPSADVADWVKNLKSSGVDFMIISNNKGPRVSKFCEPLDIKYIEEAKKPHESGFLKAASIMGKKNSEIAMVGDQIFTDIYGANRCGMTTIIVRPIRYNLFFIARRILEYPFIWLAKKKEETNE